MYPRVEGMYGHRWVAYHDLDTNAKGFKCVDCGVVDFQLRTQWDWDENLSTCVVEHITNVRGEHIGD